MKQPLTSDLQGQGGVAFFLLICVELCPPFHLGLRAAGDISP